jgi:glycosyltransferase involved in cell wall biosynthesis
LDFINPVVVPNSVDGSIFHMRGRIKYPNSMRKVRLIANSWSDNPMKGGDVYKWLEEHLDWDRYEFTFVGHTREQFTRLSHLPACASGALASILRQHDIYLTASRNDPCSNSLLEALACGLPAVYLDSGGHKEIVGNAGIGFLRREEIPAALDNLLRNYLHFQQAIRLPEFSLIAKRYLNVLLTVK